MTARRAVAVIAAAVMIVGAWFVRDRVLDDDAGTDATTGDVVCVTDLAEICRAIEDTLEVDVRVEPVDETLEAWGSADEVPNEVWVTMAPFPEMADSLRQTARLAPTDADVELVASSPLTLVANADIADEVTGTCGNPVDWACLGLPTTDLTVGFAPFPHTAIGQLGVTSAVLGFGNGVLPPLGDPAFTVWARQISRASDNGRNATTSVSTIQTRSSQFDIAVGAAAELVDPADPRFVPLTPDDSTPVDVVVATPAGTSQPGGMLDALRDELTAAGWTTPRNTSATVSPSDMLAVRENWKPYL